MVHKLTCIRCPIGCKIVIETEEDRYSFVGNECVIGVEYAKNEIRDPKRTLTTTVFVQNGNKPLLPVKSKEEIPKELLKKSIKTLSNIKVKAPVKCGDIVYKNISETGVDVVATCDIEVNK